MVIGRALGLCWVQLKVSDRDPPSKALPYFAHCLCIGLLVCVCGVCTRVCVYTFVFSLAWAWGTGYYAKHTDVYASLKRIALKIDVCRAHSASFKTCFLRSNGSPRRRHFQWSWKKTTFNSQVDLQCVSYLVVETLFGRCWTFFRPGYSLIPYDLYVLSVLFVRYARFRGKWLYWQEC